MILQPEEAQSYFKLHGALMAYANHRLEIIPGAGTAEDILRLSSAEKMKVRQALYEDNDILKRFVAENPDDLSPDELAIVASWRQRIDGDFYIFRYLKKYAVFLSASSPERLYGVLGITQTLDEVLQGRSLPILVKAVLLPFKDRIIYDGMLNTYNVFFGGGIKSSLKQTYNRLKQREGIVEQLVEPGGKPDVQTSLDRRAPRKPLPDWKPTVDEIVAQAEKIRRTETPAQGAAVSLLRAAAKACQSTLHQPDATEEHLDQLSSVRRALTKLENALYDDLHE